ncbi:30S ribosomal protein S17 [Candidatus Roizmanbacteria bacterium RIFCSPLOWO2_01_FULL_42_14]|uniref:Small ribosomal subunit protein uS17 n=4 Tax=Candidatus Roizmaniibacteriota TaxID=1752723 RepID=A0A1F7JUZ6_9BACT|nr:MAG: 30S ribosomal protein S17 [Candidatus Roizmanbacteria bacterium RIFCSPHIGHO2_02_FULL_43_11]OGK38602.1 MAG: 30S ribosomal protein S17 [Candidatus Roizmanbacteria bacterium RIFCSPHIGHO2_12_FULL_42_10]OGK52195.1 MAG: 30S ribosomal protein S17 [Candidatus Roizmanbacteria bacterium RIFCSPLOWO2_01_FULL_42_14]OGK59428.1 MAG: 30S ribosomal protein S17 [Candidatus Roizmanbacteria bacterium RIFCSPLOWO2_02_FULL_43_10]
MAKLLTGKVVSTKMAQTVVVQVERAYSHPLYRKKIQRHKKYKAHIDADMKIVEGDKVDIQECRPISKDKTFKVVKIHK